MSFTRSVRQSAFTAIVTVALVVGCNAIVGNDPGTLRPSPDKELDASPDVSSPPVRPGVSCAPDEKVCVGACVPKFNTGFHCASETSCEPCPELLNTKPVCNGPICGAACRTGYENCESSSADCETDLALPATCGACNTKCPKFCSPVGTSFGCTDSCATGLTACEMQCVDLQTNPKRCGGCDKPCPEPAHSTAACAAAACSFVCDAGFHACGASCVSDADVNFCGASCTPCGPPRPNTTVSCASGSCRTVCNPDFIDCDGLKPNGCEVDLFSDSANCGKCGNHCNPSAVNPASFGFGRLTPLVPGPATLCPCVKGVCETCSGL